MSSTSDYSVSNWFPLVTHHCYLLLQPAQLIYSFIQQMFIENLLCAKHWGYSTGYKYPWSHWPWFYLALYIWSSTLWSSSCCSHHSWAYFPCFLAQILERGTQIGPECLFKSSHKLFPTNFLIGCLGSGGHPDPTNCNLEQEMGMRSRTLPCSDLGQ